MVRTKKRQRLWSLREASRRVGVPVRKCPVCRAEILATRTIWLNNVAVSADGQIDDSQVLDTVIHLYCENDHELNGLLE